MLGRAAAERGINRWMFMNENIIWMDITQYYQMMVTWINVIASVNVSSLLSNILIMILQIKQLTLGWKCVVWMYS